ncbi:MAG: M48 family metalloprotease, partial [Pirellulaceae bacterium]|nr:M48 family metalloprotease [Pirellulaceae bacterium]
LLMGFVSRALEYEADGFVLEYNQTTRTSDMESNAQTSVTPDDLITAIRCTAELTGMALTHVTWMHPSIAERIERLQHCQTSPVLRQVMKRRLRVLKAKLLGAVLLFAGLLAMHGLVWTI